MSRWSGDHHCSPRQWLPQGGKPPVYIEYLPLIPSRKYTNPCGRICAEAQSTKACTSAASGWPMSPTRVCHQSSTSTSWATTVSIHLKLTESTAPEQADQRLVLQLVGLIMPGTCCTSSISCAMKCLDHSWASAIAWVATSCNSAEKAMHVYRLSFCRTNLALMHPRLLSSLVLIDPVIEMPAARPQKTEAALRLLNPLSTFRRDWWASREEAAAAFKKQKFYQAWDERVLQRWIDACLRHTPTALYPEPCSDPNKRPVTLLTSKHQEVFTFARPNFDGIDADGRLTLDRSTHPDLDLDSGEVYPFYRAEYGNLASFLVLKRKSVFKPFSGLCFF